MYNSYFGFTDSPFENNLDQRFIFLRSDHKEVLAALLYFIKENKGFALLCGDVGNGKTMLLNWFIERLPKSFEPIIISNPEIEFPEILLYVARKLGVSNEGKSFLELIDEVKKALNYAYLNVGEEYYLDGEDTTYARAYKTKPSPFEDIELEPGDKVDVWYRSDEHFDFDNYLEQFIKDSLAINSIVRQNIIRTK